MSQNIDVTGAQNGGGMFDVDWLTNLIVPFEFEFEGHKLKGTWYRYKTTTPDWIQDSIEKARATAKEYEELTEKIGNTQDAKEIEAMRKRQLEIAASMIRSKYAWLSQSIVSWNAIGKDKQPLPISEAVFNAIPVPFLVALGDHLTSTRTGQNPT